METVTILSDTIQEFLGERYYRCGPYFQRKGNRLHRVVYEKTQGVIPKGMHVHHIDGDRSNNSPDNLELLTVKEHVKEHIARGDIKPSFNSKARKAAAAWHKDPANREKRAAARRGVKNKRKPKTCDGCGESFMAGTARARFCHLNCKMRHYRREGRI